MDAGSPPLVRVVKCNEDKKATWSYKFTSTNSKVWPLTVHRMVSQSISTFSQPLKWRCNSHVMYLSGPQAIEVSKKVTFTHTSVKHNLNFEWNANSGHTWYSTFKGKKVRISPQQPFGSSGRGKITIGASHDHGIKSGHCLKLGLQNVKIIDGVTYATGMLIGTNLDQTKKCLQAGWDEPKGRVPPIFGTKKTSVFQSNAYTWYFYKNTPGSASVRHVMFS